MKIAMVTGSYPPDACGVGDYTSCLVKELQTCGVTVIVVKYDSWGLKNTMAIARKIQSIEPDIIHIQYPTVGYKAGLAPQMLSMLFPCVITLHEVSELYFLRRLALLPFSIRSRYIVFTSSHDQEYALQWAPWLMHRCGVIPIGSNIAAGSPVTKRDIDEIVHFSLIRPHKGLEEILQFASLIKQASLALRVLIVGKVNPRYRRYFESLQRQSKSLPIRWSTDLSEDAVSDVLSRARIAYMPFPDGASERRGSLLALLSNGVVTVTTAGKQTPPGLKDVVVIAQSPESALQQIRDIMADRACQILISKKARAYAKNFTWEVIAKKNIEVYNTILSRQKK